jgi:3-deoxy-D-manno-octulosonic-acid transferase
MHWLYSLAATLALILSAPWWLLRMLRYDKYRAGLSERLGFVPKRLVSRNVAGDIVAKQSESIWIHAVSVGEVLAVGELIKELRTTYPSTRIFLSTTTAAGQKLARQRHGEENVFYFPLDFALAIRPYLKRLRPRLVVLAETEFWPNFLRLAQASGAKVAVVNARISDRSYRGYRRWRPFLRRVLANIDLFLAQSRQDADRLAEIGADDKRVMVTGNLKFDIQPPQSVPFKEELKSRIQQAGAFPVLVCGSTVDGEEFVLLGMFQQVLRKYPRAVVVLAPRHPERFDDVARLCSASGVAPGSYPHLPGLTQMHLWRRSQLDSRAELRSGVLLLDSIGELAAIYSLATLAFVGGSLAPRGGHNILEPACFGVPILVGPHTENFRDIVSIFQSANAVTTVTGFRAGNNKADLTDVVLTLLANTSEREALGQRAAAVMKQHAGASRRTARALTELMANSSGGTTTPATIMERPVQ